MSVNDKIGNRMKEYYESVPKTRLMRRCPVALRLDGKTFHTFTRGFERPFDEVLIKTMQETAKYLCENIQGTVMAYTQSDEITLILIDYKKLNSSAWFDYEIQKMCSIAASMATMVFNKYFETFSLTERLKDDAEHEHKLGRVYKNALAKGAMFDCRCFNIPKEEVANLIYWRQLDAIRNSIQMVGQANFLHSELQFKTCDMIQDMLMTRKGIDWNDYPAYQKHGSCVIKEEYKVNDTTDTDEQGSIRAHWVIDKNIPIFKGEDRSYIEDLIML